VSGSALNVETAAGNLEEIVFLLKNESENLLTEVQKIILEENSAPAVRHPKRLLNRTVVTSDNLGR
jgi:hypothetical protein